MTNKKVPLVTWTDGVRKVVGEAIISEIGENVYFRGLVTDEETAAMLKPAGGYSIAVDPGGTS
jgi:hypothetical protein